MTFLFIDDPNGYDNSCTTRVHPKSVEISALFSDLLNRDK